MEEHPEYCSFLSRYHLSSSLISEALAYMEEHEASHIDAAKWLLQTHPELLDEWLESDKAELVRTALEGKETTTKKSIFAFPYTVTVHPEAIDKAVRSFASSSEKGLSRIQNGLGGLVNLFFSLLTHLPWFVVLFLIFLAAWKTRNIRSGILYAALVSCIGLLGLWNDMLVTFSIVLASVLLALLLGLPIGILLSYSEKANKIARPILDTMQTMPVFVYLIPALLLFGMGNASAVIATVIYAIVPVIRLTSLGLRQVDGEVVEAAVSFGSTKWQVLWKVQIPQALPTILSGVNQTLMMAMSMVVTCSMIGARGLGMEVLNAVNRIEIGRGIIAGSCVVILAVVLDRITQGGLGKKEKGETTNA
jgi:glycine betaine/proline transport system substrate-binding protein